MSSEQCVHPHDQTLRHGLLKHAGWRWENRYWGDSTTPTLLPRLNRHTGGTLTKILESLEYIYKNSEFFTEIDYMLTTA